jgi:hypothetical protein
MYCGEMSLVKSHETFNAAAVLRCRSWQCEHCRPQRAKELIGQAASGLPNRFITLTVNPAEYENQNERCEALIKAWRKLRVLIQCNLALPLHDRWVSPRNKRWPTMKAVYRKLERNKELMRKHRLPFFCVIEAQKSGEPHLHIIARCPYVPQRWISAVMKELINAPICDIRDVSQRKKLANYVAKYCGKDPHRFGTSKRYWCSPDWRLEPKEEKVRRKIGDPIIARSNLTLENIVGTFHTFSHKVLHEGKWTLQTTWQEPAFWDRTCEHDGCRHRHHLE